MPRGKKKAATTATPVAPAIAPVAPLPPKPDAPPPPESKYTNAELRGFIDNALGVVAFTDSVSVGYCAALYREIKEGRPELVVEAYVRAKDLVVEVRDASRKETVVLPGVA